MAGSEWPCNCVFCRLFVHPIARRFVAASHASEEQFVEEIKPVEVSAVQQPVIDVNGVKEAVAEHVSILVDSKLKEFASRVDSVEEEIRKIREDFSKSVDEIKSALVDIRAAVAEATNPFNVLREYSKTRKEAPKANRIIESFEQALRNIATQATASEASEAGQEPGSQIDFEKVSREVVYRGYRKLGLSGLIKLVKWVDDMLNRVPKEVIEEIAKFMKAVNVVDDEEEKIVLSVVDFVYRARKIGLKINEQIIHIYNLAKVFGVDDKEASEEILKLATSNGVE